MTGLEAFKDVLYILSAVSNNEIDTNCETIKTIEKSLKALEIIKPYLKLVGNCLQARTPFADTDYPWSFVKEITDEEEFNTLKEMLE